ncbi:hypothetical protein [Marinovum sp.]|uniref:hypothetical protein n=1 Tax=Marinovum sp. TaxID=2024839 RepID=UPI002B265807|nr:hypothetical protein [Marinovum sp.]
MTSDPLAKARAAWGADMPDWVALLASACAGASQNQVAKRLGVSATLVSNVLGAKYTGDMTRVEDIVRGAYARLVTDCPALGELPTDICRKWRRKARKLNSANSLNVTMFRACNRCPIHKGADDGQ